MSSLLSPPSLPPLSLLIRLDSGGEIIAHSRLYKVRAKVSRGNWFVVYFLLAQSEILNWQRSSTPPWPDGRHGLFVKLACYNISLQ